MPSLTPAKVTADLCIKRLAAMLKSHFQAQVSDFYEFYGKSGGLFSAVSGAFSHAEKLCESGKLRKTMSIDLTPVSGKGAFVRDPLRYGAVAVCEQLRIKTA